MRCSLWGPPEHVADAEQAELIRRLESLGLVVTTCGFDAAPPAAEVVVINSKTRIGAAQLAAMPALRLLVTTTSGHDHIDLPAAGRRGVAVVRCPLSRRDAVVDASVAMGIALLRRLPVIHRATAAGHWVRKRVKDHPVPLVRGLTVGIFGAGVIGRRASDVWTALGARVLTADPAVPGSCPPERLLAECMLVTLHCSLTDSSRRLIDAAALAQMKENAVLLNTARGECVDLEAVIAATRLGGVGLDVFAEEPYPRLAELAARGNVCLTPHSAGYHERLGRDLNDEVIATLTAWLEGATLDHRLA